MTAGWPSGTSWAAKLGEWFTWGDYRLAEPWWLVGWLGLGLVWGLRRRRAVPARVVPFAAAWHRPGAARGSRWAAAVAYAGLVVLVVAMARPQRVDERRTVQVEGYDLMIAIDLSSSMLAEDFEKDGERLNRLQAIKPILQAFVTRRPGDRIGIILFAGRAYTLAPLTFDHAWVARQIERLRVGLVEDGTAIGDGLGLALSRLEQAGRETEGGGRKGAFVILMTDGENNRGELTPEQATELAKARGVPVYTIGAGRDGLVPFPVFDDAGNRIGTRRVRADLDEATMIRIARETGGRYFRADQVGTADEAFRVIDQASKIDFQVRMDLSTTEYFAPLVWAGLAGVGLVWLGRRRMVV